MTARRSTHHVHLADSAVTKRFTSWGHGEALREWRGLTLLHRFAPGIAPAPLTAALDAEPPEVTMSRIGGTPLRGTVVSRPALRALARTLSAVHRAVPGQALAAIPTGGRSDRAFELAEISSHLSTWVDSTFDVGFFLGLFPLTEAESARIEHLRRLNALLWLGGLLSDTGTPRRNPPGTAERQAERLLALL
ncbi:hypothetical protein ACWGQL_14075 [Streptomyces lydicus]